MSADLKVHEKAEEDTPLPDAEARAIAVDPERSVVVQAPAGAGKTTLLVERFLRLLARVERPEEILAITFTTKAATEMRERVIKRLAKSDDELGAAIRTRSEQLGWGLLENPSRLHIQTIDSFARTLTTHLPLATESTATAGIAENPAQLHRRAAERALHRIHQNDNQSALLLRFIGLYDNQVNTATEALAAMLGKREQWAESLAQVIGSGSVDVEELQGALQSTIDELTDQAVANLRQWIGSGAMDDLAAVADRLSSDPAPGSEPEPVHAGLIRSARLFLTQKGTLRKQFGKEIKHLPEPVQAQLKALAKELQAYDAEPPMQALAALPDAALGIDEARNLLDVCIAIWASLEDLASEQALSRTVDFTEIMLRAKAALATPDGPTDLALALDYRLKHILVDEFQDTSTAQFDLFRQLVTGFTPGDGRTFFAVGDPMQSIYGFRDADVARFHELQHMGLADVQPEPVTLAVNFRSDGSIIDWVNTTFAGILGNVDVPEIGRVAFAPAEARKSYPEAAVKAMQFVDADDEIEAVIQRIASLLNQDTTSRIAVLVQKRPQLPPLLTALNKAGIAYTGVDIEPLGSVPIVRDIMSVISVLADPSDRISWFALLRAPFTGLALIELEQGALTNDFAGWIESRASTSPAISRLYDTYAFTRKHLHEVSPRESVEGFLLRCGAFATCDDRAAASALRCLDRIEALGNRGLDVAEVTLAIDGLFADAGPPSRVEVLTAHKAKGLEWDHVLLPFLNARGAGDRSPPLRWQSINHAGLVLSLRKGHTEDWIKKREKEKRRNELGRVLYVACTRPRRSLWLSWSTTKEKPTGGTPAALIAANAAFETVLSAQHEPAGISAGAAGTDKSANGPPLRKLPEHWRLLISNARQARLERVEVPISEALEQPAGDANDPVAAAVGDCVHMALARLADQPLPQHAERISRLLEPLWRAQCARQGVYVADTERCLRLVRRILDRTLADPDGRHLLGLHPEADVESEHSLVLQGDLITVRFDRMFVDSRGVRWIVDWKTGEFSGEDVESRLAAETVRYRPQLLRYRRIAEALWPQPVRTALYFTALPRLVIVD